MSIRYLDLPIKAVRWTSDMDEEAFAKLLETEFFNASWFESDNCVRILINEAGVDVHPDEYLIGICDPGVRGVTWADRVWTKEQWLVALNR